jgi:hypothetical protein
MNLWIYYRKWPRKGQVYVFTGGDEATREYLLHETLRTISHNPMDRSWVSTWQEAYEQARYAPVSGEYRVVIVRECYDPLSLEPLLPLVKQLKWLKIVVTSPKPKVNTCFDWPQYIIHKAGVWVQLRANYDSSELVKVVSMRHKDWHPSVHVAVVENSLASPATVLVNAEMVAFNPKPTPKWVRLVLGGGQADVFEFARAFMQKDFKKAARLQVAPLPALGAIYYRVSQVYRLLVARSRGVKDYKALTDMGVPVFLHPEITDFSHRWTASELVSLLEDLVMLSMQAKKSSNGVIELLIAGRG